MLDGSERRFSSRFLLEINFEIQLLCSLGWKIFLSGVGVQKCISLRCRDQLWNTRAVFVREDGFCWLQRRHRGNPSACHAQICQIEPSLTVQQVGSLWSRSLPLSDCKSAFYHQPAAFQPHFAITNICNLNLIWVFLSRLCGPVTESVVYWSNYWFQLLSSWGLSGQHVRQDSTQTERHKHDCENIFSDWSFLKKWFWVQVFTVFMTAVCLINLLVCCSGSWLHEIVDCRDVSEAEGGGEHFSFSIRDGKDGGR